MASAKEFVVKHGLAIGSPSTVVFNSSGVLQASALSGATISITSVDIDGGTDIGADLVDADLLLVDDGAGGTNRKSELSRVKKYIYSAVSGDATVSDTGALTIAATSVENSMLAGSIANSKLTNSTVSLGGVSIALGASDATPAFDLSDATNYPTSSLSGTITNAQLAGSIANDKLSNSTVSFGGVSLALGASDATPAFDLSDATNYPTSSLSGTITNTQLAGSIANSKLTNSTITVTDGSNSTATALGGTITFAGTANETTVSESSGTVTVGLPDNVTLASNLNVGKNVVISGNLTVSGTQTIIDTNTLNIGDNIITLNSDETGTPSQNAGIEVERGTGTNVQLRWNETADKWQFTNDGSSYEDIGAGITVQDEGSALSTAATTLNFVGSAVTASGSGATKTITIAGGDIVNDTTPQLGGTLDVNSQLINFGDSSGATDDRLNFGASQDLSIYHSGSASFIENDTGILNIVSADDSDVRIKGSAGIMAFFEDGAGVTLQYNGSQKFETTNAGINVTGTVEFDGLSGTGSVSVTDILDEDNMSSNSATALATQQSIKAYVDSNSGASVSNGSNDRILTSTGGNGIQAESDFQFDGTNVFIPNEIRHLGDPDTKIGFGTDTITLTAGGVAIQTMTTSKVGLPDSKEIAFGAGDDMTLMHDGTNSEIRNRTGELQVRANTVKLKNNDNNATYLSGVNGGAVELYHNNNKKLETTSTGTTVTGTLTATTLAGTLSTAAQANITSLGTLTALAVSGATNLGTVQAETLAIENPASHHTYTITVASKTSAHPYTGQGSSNAYFLDGKESPSIILAPNMTYRFDQANSSNSGHPLRFYLDAAKTTQYTTGVTNSGTPGSSGAYTQIVVTDVTPPVLYYQCSSHGYMGSVASSLTEGTTDHLTEGSTNLYYTNARVDTHLNTGSASSGQILSWNGSDYAWVADQTGGGGGGGSSLTVQDEGSALSTAATTLNFVGSGVTASGTGATKTITISGGGGGSSLAIKDEGSTLSTDATTLNFVGAGVTASGTGAEKTITISGTGSTTSYTPDPIYARFVLASDETIPTNSEHQVLKFTSRDVDTSSGNGFTSATDGTMTIPAGVTKVKISVGLYVVNSTDQVLVRVRRKRGSGSWTNLPGSPSPATQSTANDYVSSHTGILDCQEGDKFAAFVFSQAGSSQYIDASAVATYFEIQAMAGSALGGLGNLATLQDVHNASPTDGQALVWDNSNSYWVPGTVGAAITVQDEGSALSTSATTLNFVGSGVTASGTGATKTITISGGGGGGGSTTNFGGEFGVYTGNGSTTTFTSPLNTNHANNIIVSVDGLMQRPTTDYTISGTTVTFGTAPPAGTTVMIRSFSGELNTKASVNVQNFIGNGSNTVYKLVESVPSVNDVLVTINGIFQRPGSDYTYNTGTSHITFDEAPTLNDVISFRTFDVQARQGASVTVSDNAPTSPQSGDLWFDSTTAKMYLRYEDGSSNQWISTSTPGQQGPGVGLYANVGAFPGSGNTQGDFAIAQDTKALYVWDGAEWDRINAGGDETPRLTTTPASTHRLNADGTNTAITIAASDPEGFPITYSHDTNPASPNQVTNIVENNGVFTLVPSTNTAHAGNFTLRLKASDGVHITSHPITVTLSFSTTFTFDTSRSVINTNYTADNKVEAAVVYNGQSATTEQIGKLGKGYFEMKLISATTNYVMFGVQVGTNTSSWQNNTGPFVYQGNGGMYGDGQHNNSTYGAGSGWAVNDIVMIAYDTDAGSNGQIWFGKNGTWHRDPASTTGFNISQNSSTVGLRPAVSTGGNLDTYQVEIISHTQGAQYTVPTGWVLA